MHPGCNTAVFWGCSGTLGVSFGMQTILRGGREANFSDLGAFWDANGGVRGGGSPPGSGRTRDGYGSHSSKNPPAKETLRVAQTARSHEQGRHGSHATSRGIEDAGYTPALLGAPPPIGLSQDMRCVEKTVDACGRSVRAVVLCWFLHSE